MRLHRKILFTRCDPPPSRLQRLVDRLGRRSWPWNECADAGLGRRCPYYHCQVHGEANRAPLFAAELERRLHYLAVLDATDGIDESVLTPELFDRACALVYLDGDPR